jgi:(4S)-4-hydroxy-5-phosphonooxypentane-2,3-dione isomerase
MFVVLVEFEIETSKIKAFTDRVKLQADDSLSLEPECHMFDVCVDAASTNNIVLYEVYTNEAAFKGHLASDHFKAFDAEVAPWIQSKSVRTLTRL